MNVNLIQKNNGITYTGADGNKYMSKNLYLELPNGVWIAIRPSFKEDAKLLFTLADKK